MKIVNAGYNYVHRSDFLIDRPNGSNDYIFLVIRTPWYYVLNEIRSEVANPSIFIFKKGTPQYYGALADKYINDWIHFELNEEDLDFFSALKIKFDTPIELDDPSIFSNIIKSICYEHYSDNEHCLETTILYFKILILKFSEYMGSNNRNQINTNYYNLSKIRNKIYISPQNKISIDDLAKELNITKSYLQHLYKKRFGVCIMDDITNSRLSYAKHLLSLSHMKINEISVACGYNNDVHFMRIFKKRVGITPSAYRKLNYRSEEKIKTAKLKNPFSI